jgi:hypothetical protein
VAKNRNGGKALLEGAHIFPEVEMRATWTIDLKA